MGREVRGKGTKVGEGENNPEYNPKKIRDFYVRDYFVREKFLAPFLQNIFALELTKRLNKLERLEPKIFPARA